MKNTRSGFTIIELVAVIAILGVLAAAALPKFVDLQDQAHTAAVKGVGGSFAAAVQLVHAQWLADGGDAATDSVTLEGTTIGVTNAGFPEDSAAGDNALDASECRDLFTAIMTNAPTVATTGTSTGGEDYVATEPTANDCLYTYQFDTADTRTIAYDADNGSVVITTP